MPSSSVCGWDKNVISIPSLQAGRTGFIIYPESSSYTT